MKFKVEPLTKPVATPLGMCDRGVIVIPGIDKQETLNELSQELANPENRNDEEE